jgi:hypothetical protein
MRVLVSVAAGLLVATVESADFDEVVQLSFQVIVE